MEPRLLITAHEHRLVQLNPTVGRKGMRDDADHDLVRIPRARQAECTARARTRQRLCERVIRATASAAAAIELMAR